MEDVTRNVDMDLVDRSVVVMQDMNLIPMGRTAKTSMNAAEDCLSANKNATIVLEDILVLVDSGIP